MPKHIIVIMLQRKSIHKCASVCINPRMKLLAHVLIGMVTAEYMKNGRHTLWRQLLPVGMVDVLKIMVLVLVGEPFEVPEDLLLELGVVLDQVRGSHVFAECLFVACDLVGVASATPV